MTSELRPEFDIAADISTACGAKHVTPRAIAIIKADREAVRAEQAAELAKWKALAETLAGALEAGTRFMPPSATVWHREAAKALREYKEARDER